MNGIPPAGDGSKSFQDIWAQYNFLDRNYHHIESKCTTEDQKQQLRDAYTEARVNFWTAREKKFQDDDKTVKDLITRLDKAQQQIEQALENLRNIVTFLNQVTAAVGLATKLVALGAAL